MKKVNKDKKLELLKAYYKVYREYLKETGEVILFHEFLTHLIEVEGCKEIK